MFQLLSKHSFSLVRTYADRVFLGFRASDEKRHLYPYSLDGELGAELEFSKKDPISWIYLRGGLWLVQYEGATKEDTHVYSIEGEWQQTIPHLHADLYILKSEEDWVYLINERFSPPMSIGIWACFLLKNPSFMKAATVVSTSSLARGRVSW